MIMRFVFFFLTLFLPFFVFSKPVSAVCPLCTVAVGAGLGISRWLGIDDTVVGVWIGGLILSSGLWLSDFIGKKGIKIHYRDFVSTFLMFVFVIPPLYWSHFIGIKGNTFWGVDKILLGILFGSFVFLLGVWLDGWLRTKNNGKVFIYYQKVVVPVFLLTLTSFIFYLLTL